MSDIWPEHVRDESWANSQEDALGEACAWADHLIGCILAARSPDCQWVWPGPHQYKYVDQLPAAYLQFVLREGQRFMPRYEAARAELERRGLL